MRQLRAAARLCTVPHAGRASLPRVATTAQILSRARTPGSSPRSGAGHARLVRGFASSPPARAAKAGKDKEGVRKIDMSQFPPERIRNLSIIAHIDHGKSTLADRLLQMTNTVPAESSPQFLDKLKVERERGITVKAQTVSIILTHTDGKQYLVNLIDTPGHVDFSYEVSRSLGACEGGLLLVDCTQGIQAQTLSVFHVAAEAELKLLPVINKVDLPHAYPEETSEEIASSLGLPVEDHMRISAKSGLGVDQVLRNIVDGLPPPKWDGDDKLRALVFDTFYDRFRGVVSLIRIVSGSVKRGDKVQFLQAGKKYDVLDVGIYNPDEVIVDALREGQVGYVVCNMKNSAEAFIGDTMCLASQRVEALPGFKPMKAMVFAGVFPIDSAEFQLLEESIERLTLNDRSVTIEKETSAALGQGFRLGFLGTLHMDVFRQRLEDEYASNVIVTAPTVPYKVVYTYGKEEFVSNPADFPETTDTKTRVAHVEEPFVNATIFVPSEYIGAMFDLCAKYRGTQLEYRHMDGSDRVLLRYQFPLSEIVTNFFSDLKSASSGFASFDYEEAGYKPSKLVKLNMLLNGKPVDALAMIVHKDAAQTIGKAWVKKLRDELPRQLFELAIQAAIGNRVVARESLSAMRKDVTAGLYGGHYERKLKHLNKQKEGKKRLKKLAGNIEVPQTAFFNVLSSRPRSYATSARGSSPRSDNSWLKDIVPSPPASLAELAEDSEVSAPAPLGRPTMSPQNRSEILGTIYRQVDQQASGEPSHKLFGDFTRLYLSSPSPLFSAPELRAIAQAVHARDRRSTRKDQRQAHERFETVVNALRDVVGEQEQVPRGLELSMLVSASKHRRSVNRGDLKKAERQFLSSFRSAPSDPARREQYFRGLNHILYLSALARQPERTEFWWGRMLGEGFTPDSWSYLSRVLVYGALQGGRGPAAFLGELERALPQIPRAEDKVVLVNTAVWLAAVAKRMDVAGALYTTVCPAEDPASHSHAVAELPVGLVAELGAVAPTRETFALMLAAYTYHGDLVSALTTMQRMLARGHPAAVADYVALFRGFARFGAILEGPSGAASLLFPPFVEFAAHTTLHEVRARPRRRATGFFDSLRGRARSESEHGHEHDPAPPNHWTLEAFDDVFHGFLALTPGRGARARAAPTPKGVHFALLAWARVTNGDLQAVWHAYDTVRSKFGPGNPEGWAGWDEDTRLRQLGERLEKKIRAREQSLEHL